jgi:D-proline reductase (dithiol) PrdB
MAAALAGWHLAGVSDELIRRISAEQPVPNLGSTPYTEPPSLDKARVAIVTTAALRQTDQPRFGLLEDQTFRVLKSSAEHLVMDHASPNFDRTGWLRDVNVVFPIDRLHELAADGRIGSVAATHLSFVGAQQETLTSIRLDSGPAAGELLRRDGVDVVILTPV